MGRPRNPPPAVGADLAALEAAFAVRGPEAIRLIREADPRAYFRLMAEAIALDDDGEEEGDVA